MSTSSLVSEIRDVYNDFPVTKVLNAMNRALEMMLKNRNPFLEVIDETTGKYPVVSLVSGQRKYEISVANGFPEEAWFIGAVRDSYGETIRIKKYRASGSSKAYFIVRDDNIVGDYYVEYYKFVPKLTAVTVPLTIPEEFERYLYHGIIGIIEDKEYGRSEKLTLFENKYVPDFLYEMFESDEDFEENMRSGYGD